MPCPRTSKPPCPIWINFWQALNVPVLRLDGYEADDLIGTIARQAEEAGYEAIMVTPDKDYAQLVGPQRSIWRPAKKGSSGFDKLGVAEVCEEWGVQRVEQVIDVLGLMGDSSDNVPGVPGIGPKTAKDLIAQFDSLDGIYEHLDELKGKKKRKYARNFREQAFLSRTLVTIDTAVPSITAWKASSSRSQTPRPPRKSLPN